MLIAARVARVYEPGEQSGCPGEENCDTWRSSAPDAPVRCPSCPKRQASGDGTPETLHERRLLDRVERLRRQRDSARPLNHVSAHEWELLHIYDEQHDAYKRAHDLRVAQMFEMMARLLVR